MSDSQNKKNQPAGNQSVSEEALFNALQAQYTKLRDRKITVQTQRTSVGEQLKELQASAEKEFGTHDVAALKKKLEQMEAENEKKLNDYQKTLNEIDTQLAEIDNDLKSEQKSEQIA